MNDTQKHIVNYDIFGHLAMGLAFLSLLLFKGDGIQLITLSIGLMTSVWYFGRVANFLSSCGSKNKYTDLYLLECKIISYASYFCLLSSLILIVINGLVK